MSWTYLNKHGVRIIGTSNGYYRLEIIDDVDGTPASIEFLHTDADRMREIADALKQAASDLERE